MQEILRNLPVDIRQAISSQDINFGELTEIRMRVSKRLVLYYGKREVWLNTVINKRHMSELLEFTTRHSAYAYENQLRQGYITVEGGHRIGFCGKAIVKDGQAWGFKNISSANIRIAHEVKDCAAKVMPYIVEEGRVYNTLIIAPPGCGKTTILRDIIRQLSQHFNVGVCDERGEIAAMYDAVPSNDLGDRTDVIEGCDKATSMEILLRTMAPSVIAVDEIGSNDIKNLNMMCNMGCSAIATIHGKNPKELIKRENLKGVINNFERLIVISNAHGAGTIESIFAWKGDDFDQNNSDSVHGFMLLYDRTKLLQ